ncbi:hypothetical protein ACFX2I_043525 [Malus domestica]
MWVPLTVCSGSALLLLRNKRKPRFLGTPFLSSFLPRHSHSIADTPSLRLSLHRSELYVALTDFSSFCRFPSSPPTSRKFESIQPSLDPPSPFSRKR